MNKKYIITLVILLIISISAYYYGKSKAEIKYDKKEVIRIEKEIDTFYMEVKEIKEVIKEKKEERAELQEKEMAIKYDSICDEIVDNLKAQLKNCDETIVYKDRIIEKLDTVIMYKDRILEIPMKKESPFYIGGGVEKQNDEYPFSLNAGFKIDKVIILGGVNTKGQAELKAIWNL